MKSASIFDLDDEISTRSVANTAAIRHSGGVANRDRNSSVPLDSVSKAIIEQLQEDGRRAYATIGKAVGLSEAAVRQRVRNCSTRA